MDEFKTSDLYEAAFIYTEGGRLLRLEGEGQRKSFVFEGKEKSEEIANKYYDQKYLVNAKMFADSIRTLKDRVFAR